MTLFMMAPPRGQGGGSMSRPRLTPVALAIRREFLKMDIERRRRQREQARLNRWWFGG